MQVDLTKPVMTRDGRKARVICTDAKSEFPIIVLIECAGVEVAMSYKADCRFCYMLDGYDLVNVPEDAQ